MSTTVVRTTTEKLDAELAKADKDDRYIVTAQYLGGRDWVLILAQPTVLEVSSGPPVYGRESVGEWPLADQSADPDYDGGALIAMSRNPSVDFCQAYYRGHQVPHIKVYKYPVDAAGEQVYPPEGRTDVDEVHGHKWELILDDRMLYDFDTETQALHAVRMLADAMAIAAGWTCHGSANRLNPHGPATTETAVNATPS